MDPVQAPTRTPREHAATESTVQMLSRLMPSKDGAEQSVARWSPAIRSKEVQEVLYRYGEISLQDLCERTEKGKALLQAIRKATGEFVGIICN